MNRYFPFLYILFAIHVIFFKASLDLSLYVYFHAQKNMPDNYVSYLFCFLEKNIIRWPLICVNIDIYRVFQFKFPRIETHFSDHFCCWTTQAGGWFSVKMSYMYRKSHWEDKILRPSNLHNNMAFLYWTRTLAFQHWSYSDAVLACYGICLHL